MLSWRESKLLAKKYGVPVVNSKIVNSMIEARDFMKNHERIVVKLYSCNASHKTDKKLVFTDLNDRSELGKVYAYLERRREKLGGEIVVQEFVDGISLIIGGKKDETFGPVVMLGLGGIYAEVFKDTVFRLAPISLTEAGRMINELKSHEIFSARGKKYDKNELKKVLRSFSRLISSEEIKYFDVNPFILSGKGGWAVDLRFEQ